MQYVATYNGLMWCATPSKPIVDKCNMLQLLNTCTLGKWSMLQPLHMYNGHMLQPLSFSISQINGKQHYCHTTFMH
jgi:hypothetical protein